LALALTTMVFALAECAEAQCTPTAPPGGLSNTTVTCTGATLNGNGGITGFGTVSDDNNTYIIKSGSTVTGNSFGVQFGTGEQRSIFPAP
jgi:hypothetical protein